MDVYGSELCFLSVLRQIVAFKRASGVVGISFRYFVVT
ncbi:hypothetical protein M076_0232 [Bacteroides fragilis str. 2-F-2 |uniref:Uncharacterized protein n=1 Tax=Bacteroides fragilis str. 2-F-2 \|nr:hypothetical protein M078_0286 [Bacteroides fragilis str. 2-F-2 \